MRTLKKAAASSLAVVCVLLVAIFTITACNITFGSENKEDKEDPGVFNTALLQAEPHPASGIEEPPKVIASYNNGESNFYLIDVGYISKMFISELGTFDYTSFVGQSFGVSKTNTTTVTNSLTTTVSESIAISNTVGVKTSTGAEVGVKLGVTNFAVKTNFEESWSATASVTGSKSKSDTATTATAYSQGLNLSYVFKANDPQGTYRCNVWGL
jgi:hypothetical protein